MDLPTFEDLFRQIKTNLWVLGLTFNVSRIQFRFYCMVVCIFLLVIEESAFLISKCAPENFLELTHLAPCTCSGLLCILKLLPIAAKKQKIFELTNSLDRLYSDILSNPKKKEIVVKEIILFQILIKYFFILNGILISVYNFSTLIFILYNYIRTNEMEYSLPYAVIVPFSIESFPAWFIVYTHSIICGFIWVLFFTTVDGLYYILTSQICNNFTVLCNEIMELDENNVDRLRALVISHQYILKLSEDLEEIFKLPHLFNVLVGSLEICALGFNLTMGDVAEIPGCVLFLSSVLLQILMMSVFGEKLIGESRKVGEAAFCCKWTDMDEKSKKTILIIITRSNKQQQLTAYNFSVISYASFTTIISTSWSYFTILRTVYTPPESTGTV